MRCEVQRRRNWTPECRERLCFRTCVVILTAICAIEFLMVFKLIMPS